MARPKSGKTKKDSLSSKGTAEAAAVQTPGTASFIDDGKRPGVTKAESRKLEAAGKSESRATVLPHNLEEEIRRRAYELYERRGYSSGHETEDWLIAEREVMQRHSYPSA